MTHGVRDTRHVPHPLPAATFPAPDRCAWAMFAVLLALMVIDYVDRQVVVSLFPHLKGEWQLADVELGALASVVAIMVAVCTVPLSFAADRWGHVRSIFAMAMVWSSATIACAFAPGYASMLAARGVVGVGEAAYGSVGAALIGTLFPERMRGTVLGVFLAGGVVGSVIGIAAGGMLARSWGWQGAFGVVGVPGLGVALALLAIAHRCRTHAQRPASQRNPITLLAALATVRRTRTIVLASIGAGLQMLGTSAVYAWLPSYLHRYHDLAPDRAGAWTGGVVMIGLAGIVGCSSLADHLAPRIPRARLLVPAIAALATAACMVPAFALMQPDSTQFALIIGGAAMMTGHIGSLAAVVIDVVDPRVRATAASVLALTQNLLGLAAGPVIAGAISDRYGLDVALAITPLFCIPAALCYLAAGRSYLRERERARAALGAGSVASGGLLSTASGRVS